MWRLVFVFLLAGCNHLFYFPSRETFLTPDKVKVAYDERKLKVGGETLAVWHLKAVAPAQKVVVVHFHGNGENMTSHFLYSGWMTKAGWDVVTFDYRGYGKSTGTPSRDGLVEDGLAVLDWVGSAPEFKGSRIVVFAQSLGGAVAVPVTALAPKGLVEILAVDSTFDSYRGMAREVLSNFWLSWPLQWPLSFFVSGAYSPDDYIDRINIPFLAMHSKVDPVVPFTRGQALFADAKMKDKTFWTIDEPGHTEAFRADDSDYREKFVDYVCQRLASPCARK